ncbi:MAG: ABC transporter permease [Anaerolineales bacterium]|nr:ABC transporter permease [Anaerolineales bacterium]
MLFRRLGFLVLTLLITSLIIFSITQLLPGDVARVILGREAGEESLRALRLELGLNDSPITQYLRWGAKFVSGDWGTSFSTRQTVFSVVVQRLRNSLMLAGVILIFSVPLAILLGVVAGIKQETWIDHIISISSLAVVGLPEFLTGLVLIELLAFQFKFFPANSSIRVDAGFWESLPMLILPALTATLVLLAYIARLTRAGVIEELKQPYVRTAVLKGLTWGEVMFKHVLRNALMPTVTVIAISFGWMLSGLIVVENVFNYPGLGRLLVFAIDRRDLPLLQAIGMVTVLGYTLANLAADLLYAVLNPRIRLQ